MVINEKNNNPKLYYGHFMVPVLFTNGGEAGFKPKYESSLAGVDI